MARHAGVGRWNNDPKLTNNMNRFSIGIELLGIGADHEMFLLSERPITWLLDIDRGFTDEQYQSIGMLVDQLWIVIRFQSITFLGMMIMIQSGNGIQECFLIGVGWSKRAEGGNENWI